MLQNSSMSKASCAILAAISAGWALCLFPAPVSAGTASSPHIAVGAQYDTTHVYANPAEVDKLVASLIATFGGASSKQIVATVTPTPSSTTTQIVRTPSGTFSVFGFRTPIPYPFGLERNGYLVQDMDAAVRAAKAAGADVVVTPFPDPIGQDAVVQWPGGVNMQLYWHTTVPSYEALASIPENRIYVSPGRLKAFVRSFITFSQGKIVSDDLHANGDEIGRPGDTFERVRIESPFGKMEVLATDGHLPYPYGREMTGYGVSALAETLARAEGSGARIVVATRQIDDHESAIVEFPGGYLAEIHGPPSSH